MNNLALLFALAFALPVLLPILTPILSLLFTQLVKAMLPKIPGWALPLTASLAGVGVDAANHFATGADLNPTTAALLGLAATGLHQIKVQATK